MDLMTADKLQKLRKAHGLSQDALAERLGISRQSISKWERGESTPDTDNLIALASVYGISLDELIGSGNTDVRKEDKEDTPMSSENQQEIKKNNDLAKSMFKFPMPLIIVIVYLVLSFLTQLWHPLWIMFLLIPTYYHLAGALCCKTVKGMMLALPVPEIILIIYLGIGFISGGWGIGATLFLIIPLYYWLSAIKKK